MSKQSGRRSIYRSRYERVPNPPNMRVTKRDVRVVKTVYEYRVMTIPQVLRLLFPPDNPDKGPKAKLSVCKRRLHLLFQHGFLEREVLPVGPFQGAPQVVHLLDRRGADLLAAELGVDREDISWKPYNNDVSTQFLEHTLRVNDFRIAVTLAAKDSGHQVARWISEEDLRAMKERVEDPRDQRKLKSKRRTIPIIPDGHFVYRSSARRGHFFFVEVDRGTMTNRRFADKIRGYQAYFITPVKGGKSLYERRYGTKSLRILTATTSPRRLKNLKETTEEAGGKGRFWFTTFEHLSPEEILGPVWVVAGRDSGERVSLIE